MIRSYGCSWSCEQPWTTAISDHAPPPAERPGCVRRDRVDRVGLVGPLPVGAPFPARIAGCPPRDPGLARVPSGSPRPPPCGGGRVGCTTEPWGAWAAVPDWGARPLLTRPPRFGCHATGCGPDPHTPALSRMIEAKPPRGRAAGRAVISRNGAPAAVDAAPVPIPLITPQTPGAARGANGTTASQVAPKSRWSRPERACPRVGDGRPSNHMIR
jgi:hypothetical protein